MVHQKLVTWYNPESPAAEIYRILRTNIQFIANDNKIKTILITSPGPKEGKSLIIANLAVSMAQNNKKVILIDANLRHPVLHDLFNVLPRPGVTEVLLGQTELSPVLQETAIKNLSLLTTGQLPANPAEMIASAEMKQIIQEAGNLADLVLIDSPPLLSITDGALLAALADGVIMVIARGLTEEEQALEAKRIINSSKTRLMGIIFNNKFAKGHIAGAKKITFTLALNK